MTKPTTEQILRAFDADSLNGLSVALRLAGLDARPCYGTGEVWVRGGDRDRDRWAIWLSGAGWTVGDWGRGRLWCGATGLREAAQAMAREGRRSSPRVATSTCPACDGEGGISSCDACGLCAGCRQPAGTTADCRLCNPTWTFATGAPVEEGDS